MFWGGRSRDRDRNGAGILLIVGLVLAILTPIVASLIQLAVSRQREYLADASGAFLTRYPEGLANALRKIAADEHVLGVANKATASLYISNPLKDHPFQFDHLFDTQFGFHRADELAAGAGVCPTFFRAQRIPEGVALELVDVG